MNPVGEDPNPHYEEHGRWTTGLGWYGQNAALFAFEWDPSAAPEVLCNEVIATEVAMRRGRRVIGKLESGVDCDGEPGREFHGLACDGDGCHPSWYDVHNGTQRGDLCPVGEGPQKAFARRARKNGLDPFSRVTKPMLGLPIKREGQDERAAQLTARLEDKAPVGAQP